MKLYDSKLEIKVLRTVCEAPPKIKYNLLAKLNDSHFHTDSAKEVYERIIKLSRKEAEIPSYKELVHDPVISESTRTLLKRSKKFVETKKEANKLFDTIEQYRKARLLYFMGETVNERLVADKVDVQDILDYVGDTITKIQSDNNREEEIFHVGKGNNTSQIVKNLLKNEKPKLVPTGFDAFDRKNGGFAWGSSVLLAGTSGSGKTSLALNLGLNMTEFAHEDVLYIPLEMDEEETFERILANKGNVPIEKIKMRKLRPHHKKRIAKGYSKWVKQLKENDTRFTIFSPYDGITLEEALFVAQPFNYRIIIVDYLGLMKLRGKKDQWQELSDAAWLAKTWAKKTKCIVILLAQLSDESDAVRYSRALVEHANNAWLFRADKESRENKIMNIVQRKARNQYLFDFQLGYTDDTYKVFDLDDLPDYSKAVKDEGDDEGYMENADD